MFYKKIIRLLLLFILSLSYETPVFAARLPLYIGFLGGGGSTTWYGLVPKESNQNLAIGMSTPTNAHEGGSIWGLLAGFELSPFFGFEANYLRYPKAELLFDETSLFSFDHEGLIQLFTKTEMVSFMGKVMLIIPNTPIRLYSSAGIANVHREDLVMDQWRTTPTFGLGFNFPITEHFLGELAGNYAAGYGESSLNPTDTFFPFLYSVSARLAYYF